MDDPLPFGEWLKELRRSHKLTRLELGRKIGCAAVMLEKIETGERRPSLQISELLAQHLEIPAADREAFVQLARGEIKEITPSLIKHGSEAFHNAPLIKSRGPTSSLPAQVSTFIGRDAEVSKALSMIRRKSVRLLCMTGPGGVGKTRLALRVAGEVPGDFRDGIYFVPPGTCAGG